MKRLILNIVILMFLSTYSKGADKYDIGDNLFIWAKSGLNLRSGPGTNFKVIEKLGFGEEILVKEKSEKTYNITGISKVKSNYYSRKVDPLIFKGKWVKVLTESGNEGFLIDQYLLSVQPKDRYKRQMDGINLDLVKVDTVLIHDGSGFNRSIEKIYLSNIKSTESSGGSWYELTYMFPNYSVEEALILLSSVWNDYKNFTILRNWKEELILQAYDCKFKITLKENEVRIIIFCSC